MNSMKKRNDTALKEGLQVGRCLVYYRRRAGNSSRGTKRLSQSGNNAQLWMLSGGETKVQCCKEKDCRGTRGIRSMNQGKLIYLGQTRVGKSEIDILRIRTLNGRQWVRSTQVTITSATAGENPIEETEWPSQSTREPEMQYLGAVSKTTD